MASGVDPKPFASKDKFRLTLLESKCWQLNNMKIIFTVASLCKSQLINLSVPLILKVLVSSSTLYHILTYCISSLNDPQLWEPLPSLFSVGFTPLLQQNQIVNLFAILLHFLPPWNGIVCHHQQHAVIFTHAHYFVYIKMSRIIHYKINSYLFEWLISNYLEITDIIITCRWPRKPI